MVLDGELENAGHLAGVAVSDLESLGCALDSSDGSPPCDSQVALWIGAVGPLAAIISDADGPRARARFCEPLDARIVDHFKAG